MIKICQKFEISLNKFYHFKAFAEALEKRNNYELLNKKNYELQKKFQNSLKNLLIGKKTIKSYFIKQNKNEKIELLQKKISFVVYINFLFT